MVSLPSWHVSYDQWRQQLFNLWVEEKDRSGTLDQMRPSIVMPFHKHHGCLVFISDR